MDETVARGAGAAGLTESRAAPCVLVIFGGAGDLARRKLLPAIYDLHRRELLPEPFAVVGCGRRELTDEDYRGYARDAAERHGRGAFDASQWRSLAPRIHFVSGDFDDEELFSRLAGRLSELESEHDLPHGRVFYFAVPPSLFETLASRLDACGLLGGRGRRSGFSRVIVEKPIGHDLDSARRINAAIARVFDEREIFRIDHFLGKETVQNIFVMRFANAIFEPLWNEKHIDHVQITVAEDRGIDDRGAYYDATGALRDMVQNHMLQLLALVAMEPPWAMTADVLRDHKLDVLNCLRPIERCDECVVRAQYAREGAEGAEPRGYREEKNVSPRSTTETFVALKTFVDNWRWAGVPFYLRTGKRLPRRATEVAVQFKQVPRILFNADARRPLHANVLALRIQPDEGFSLGVSAKRPGPDVRLEPVEMDFRYESSFEEQAPEPYERLLVDVMAGDDTLFMRRDEVEVAWEWTTRILEHWAGEDVTQLPRYAPGTWGPDEAERLIAGDGHAWRAL